MSTPDIERKLAAIMFTDIVGYTESMSTNESKSLNILEKKRSIFKPLLEKYKGTFVKEIGDGTLSYFDSAVNAARCAVKLQEYTYDDNDINIRAGINIGDIVFKDGDVFGDGVNVASRLESIAPQGGVCVSKNVYDELINQDDFDAIDLGLQSFKGVGRLVEVYGLKGDKLNEPNPEVYLENKIDVHTDNETPSIAIIPFENKGDEEDVFYTYGISADLISDCTSAGLIRVSSLKDIEKLDYNNLETSVISEKLLVRYVAQGALWKRGNMFQLSVELYDSKDKRLVWSDRWQEAWDNLSIIKEVLSDGLLKALDSKPKVEQYIETINPEAYEFYLKAKHKYEKREDINDIEIARGLLQKSIELDDKLILAKNLLGSTYSHSGNYDKAMDIFILAFTQANNLNDKYSIGYCLNNIGNVNQFKGDLDTALDYYYKSLAIRQDIGDENNIAYCMNNIGLIYRKQGNLERALEYYEKSLVINEELEDQHGIAYLLNNIGQVCFDKGDLGMALEYYKKSLKINKTIIDKHGIGNCLNNFANLYHSHGKFDKSIDYLEKALLIREELGNKRDIGFSLHNLGIVNYDKGDLDGALDYFKKSLSVREEIGHKEGISFTLIRIGSIYKYKGDLNRALKLYETSLSICESMGDNLGISNSLRSIGFLYFRKYNYEQAIDFLNKSLEFEKRKGKEEKLEEMVYLYLSYKNINKKIDLEKVYVFIDKVEKINFELNFRLYELLEDIRYLDTAYNQLQEKVRSMENELKEKYLNFKTSSLIIEKWEKVSKVEN